MVTVDGVTSCTGGGRAAEGGAKSAPQEGGSLQATVQSSLEVPQRGAVCGWYPVGNPRHEADMAVLGSVTELSGTGQSWWLESRAIEKPSSTPSWSATLSHF